MLSKHTCKVNVIVIYNISIHNRWKTAAFSYTELESKTLDFDTLKKQSEGTNKEYDRLTKEFAQVQVILCGKFYSLT